MATSIKIDVTHLFLFDRPRDEEPSAKKHIILVHLLMVNVRGWDGWLRIYV